MCGRFNMISDPLTQLIMQIVNGELGEVSIENRYNVAPTEDVPVLLKTPAGEWQLQDMRWWLVPNWSDAPSTKYTMFNAKSETLSKSRAFQMPFRRQRCIVPASGYYEWQKQASGKMPYLIQPAETKGFAFAGLWDSWQRGDQRVDSCTIITGAAPEAMSKYHHRVPIHLSLKEVDRWLNLNTDPDELKTLLSPHMREPIMITPVSNYVGNSRNKDARSVEPLGDSEIVH